MKILKKLCVIGAGAAGLVAAKHAVGQDYEVDVFEQTDQIGGTWVYSEQTGCHSSLYKVMKTNLPKEAMLFEDVPFSEHLPSFMSHEHVLNYLIDYSKDLPIHFNTTVLQVARENDKWKVSTRTTPSSVDVFHFYDAVFVCNGHFFEPLNPYSSSPFKGSLLHSHDYRRAEHFTDKRVVIIGAGPSGIDITLQVTQTASHVTLISKKATYPVLPSSVLQVATHVERVVEDGVVTDEGEHFGADVIIVCTGYVFKFPFLDESLIQLKHHDLMVSPLYQHLCHVDYPKSLFFIGVPLGTITFPLFEVQVKYALSLIAGKGKLPDDVAIRQFESARLHALPNPMAFHVLVEEQWGYMKELAELGGFEEWSYMETIRKLYSWIMTERRRNVIGYKAVNFELTNDSTDFRVVPVDE